MIRFAGITEIFRLIFRQCYTFSLQSFSQQLNPVGKRIMFPRVDDGSSRLDQFEQWISKHWFISRRRQPFLATDVQSSSRQHLPS